MSTFEDRTLLEDLLANGVDDWIYLSLVWSNIADRATDDRHSDLLIERDPAALAVFEREWNRRREQVG